MTLFIDSYIESEFEGWDDDKIFKLDNGTKWKLASYRYSYKYAYRPKAKIWSNGGSYYLEVDGMNEKVEVNQLY